VGQYTKDTEELIQIFNSISEACKQLNHPTSHACIRRALANPNFTAFGNKWKLI
jgi:hypothetical protein